MNGIFVKTVHAKRVVWQPWNSLLSYFVIFASFDSLPKSRFATHRWWVNKMNVTSSFKERPDREERKTKREEWKMGRKKNHIAKYARLAFNDIIRPHQLNSVKGLGQIASDDNNDGRWRRLHRRHDWMHDRDILWIYNLLLIFMC